MMRYRLDQMGNERCRRRPAGGDIVGRVSPPLGFRERSGVGCRFRVVNKRFVPMCGEGASWYIER
jgi:hypothetical protein